MAEAALANKFHIGRLKVRVDIVRVGCLAIRLTVYSCKYSRVKNYSLSAFSLPFYLDFVYSSLSAVLNSVLKLQAVLLNNALRLPLLKLAFGVDSEGKWSCME